jgi:hypothetical protein
MNDINWDGGASGVQCAPNWMRIRMYPVRGGTPAVVVCIFVADGWILGRCCRDNADVGETQIGGGARALSHIYIYEGSELNPWHLPWVRADRESENVQQHIHKYLAHLRL